MEFRFPDFLVGSAHASCDTSSFRKKMEEMEGHAELGDPCMANEDCYSLEQDLLCKAGLCVPECSELTSSIFIPCGSKETVGVCHPGSQEISCTDGNIIVGECSEEGLPSLEVCDGLDNDCNGSIDQMTEHDISGCPLGSAHERICINGAWSTWSGCNMVICKEGENYSVACGTDEGECSPGFKPVWCEGGMYVTDETICAGSQEAHSELCDGKDNDCDGSTDEDFNLGEPCSSGVGECRQEGTMVCAPDSEKGCNVIAKLPSPEICDNKDNDCDGSTDEELGTIACGTGVCAKVVQACVDGALALCNALSEAAKEICNGLDDDCDGSIDEEYPLGQPCSAGVGECASEGIEICGNGGIVCSADPKTARAEQCDNKDNDCDGLTDEKWEFGQTTCGTGVCEHTIDNCIHGALQSCNPFEGMLSEVCNGLDDDCDGIADNVSGFGEPCSQGVGACLSLGTMICSGNVFICSAVPINPETEIACNDVDEDCDGVAFQGTDRDNDGFKLEGGLCGPLDCNDNLNIAHPGAPAGSCINQDLDCDGNVTSLPLHHALITHTPGFSWNVSMAWNDREQEWGLAWTDVELGISEIYFTRTDRFFNRLSEDLQISDDPSFVSNNPKILWLGSKYGLLWQDGKWGHYGISLNFLDFEGRKLNGDDIRVNDFLQDTCCFDAVWTGAELMTSWSSYRTGISKVYLNVRDGNGGGLSGEDIPVSDMNEFHAADPGLAWNGSMLGVAWNDLRSASFPQGHTEIYFAGLNRQGQKVLPDTRISYLPNDSWIAVPAAFDSTFGISWWEYTPGNGKCCSVNFALVDPSGTPSQNYTVLTDNALNGSWPAVTSVEGGFFAMWENDSGGFRSTFHGSLLGEQGNPMGGTLQLEGAAEGSRQPSSLWNGSEIGVCWSAPAEGFLNTEIECSLVGCR